MKRIILLGISALLLSGCSGTTGGEWGEFHYIDGPNGKKIPCVVSSNGGVNCDWKGF